MVEYLALLRLDGESITDERLLAWLADPSDASRLSLETASRRVPVQRLLKQDIAAHFGFSPEPKAD
jgi:hypothetical protein